MARQFNPWTPGVLPGGHDEPRLQDVPQVGRAVSVSAAGVLVEIDGQRGVVYGPAPWCLGSCDSAALAIVGGFAPRADDRVLLVFAGVGVETPTVVSWWR